MIFDWEDKKSHGDREHLLLIINYWNLKTDLPFKGMDNITYTTLIPIDNNRHLCCTALTFGPPATPG